MHFEHVMRPILTLGFLLATTVFAVAAHAEDASVAGNIDAHAGAGFGSIGFASHLGIGAQAWFGEVFGIGAEAGFLEDDAILFERTKSHATYIGPTLSARSSGGASYLFATAGAGYVSRTVQPGSSSFCIWSPCSQMYYPSRSDSGLDLSLSLGAAFHFGALEVGPHVRAESIAGKDLVATLNIALGAVIARGGD
jgi:outer membrane protein with beta-barrel domain